MPPGEGWVALGTGAEEYTLLLDGSTVSIDLGLQGSHMVVLAIQAGGVDPGDPNALADPDNPRIQFRGFSVDTGEQIAWGDLRRGLTTVDEDTFELAGAYVVFNGGLDESEYFDREIRVEVTLVDAEQTTYVDEVIVTAAAPE